MLFSQLATDAQAYDEAIDTRAMETMDTETLIDTRVPLAQVYASIRSLMERLDWVIQTRMEREGQRALDHPRYEVELAYPAAKYDQSKLMALLELVAQSTAEDAGAYIPAHEVVEQIPARWDVRKARTLTKYGEKIGVVIDGAKLVGRPTLKVTPRKAK
jgi:hypothetical protein